MIIRYVLAALGALSLSTATHAQELGSGGRPVGEAWTRSEVYGANGMAATAHPLATQIAIDILKQGGNAVDAAIAANAALGLMEPTGNGIGGDLFAIIWDPKTEQLYGLNASGRAPMGRTHEAMIEKAKAAGDETLIPFMGSLAVTVPGAVDGWFEMHKRFGKISMQRILDPAIAYAEDGHPVAPIIANYWARNFDRFATYQNVIEEFDNARSTYLIDGAPPKAGEIFRNPYLAKTYSLIANRGRDAYYKGEIARTIDSYMKRIGGDLRYEDFAAHRSEWTEPSCIDYRAGHSLCELPPNGQGFAALQMLNILKNVDLSRWRRGSAEVIHYITEAKRLAFEDSAAYYADPEFSPAPLETLLSDSYGQARFALIDPEHANSNVGPGAPELESPSDTTYLTVADNDGMMVSLIQSNYAGMGAGLVPDKLGFMLQNRGAQFALDPEHANVYAPGKRPYHTIIPAFLLKDGEPYISFGLMGGGMQPQGHVQIVINIVDYGMGLQEAGDVARLHHDGGSQPTGVTHDALGVLQLEPGVPMETVKKLRAMGHNPEIEVTGVPFGGYQAIRRHPETGVYEGATEMRKDGVALGY